MKKLKLLTILALPLFMTGCVKINATMKVNLNKSMDYELIEAIDTSLMGSLDDSNGDYQIIDEEEMKTIKQKGFKVEDYTEDNMKGYRVTKHFKNIDSISTDEEIKSDISMSGDKQYVFTVKKGFFKNTYTAVLTSDSTDQVTEYADSDDTTDQQQYEQLMSQMDLKFRVEVPFKAKSSNATSTAKGGRELTWDLTKHQDDIKFTFALYNLENIAVVVGIIFVGLLGIIIGYIKTRDKNDDNNKSEPNNTVIQNNNVISEQPQFVNNPINYNSQINTNITNDTFINDQSQVMSNQVNVEPQINNIPNDTFINDQSQVMSNPVNVEAQPNNTVINEQPTNTTNDIFNQNFPK